MLAVLLMGMILLGVPFTAMAAPDENSGKVMVIELSGNVESGLASYMERSIEQAEAAGADWILVEMDTPGGSVEAAQEIKAALYGTKIPKAVLVKNQAISAGAYIALCCDKIGMMPGSTIGDAEMLLNGVRADEKYLGPWREEFASIAEDKGRDPEIARAFVDRDIAIEGIIEEGKLLTLTPQRALELGFSDVSTSGREEFLNWLGMENPQLLYSEETKSEKIARMLTNPVLAPVLLSFGIILVVVELVTPGLGVAGIAGVILLAAYFGGHMMAGMASWVALLLFLVGIVLCIIEIFTPGFGIFAVGGIICIGASIFFTTPDLATAIRYITVMLLIILICVPILIKVLSRYHFFDRFMVRKTMQGTEAGNEVIVDYVGRYGTAMTVLRPAGTVELEDGTRVDVVTQGDYIEKGEPVQIIRKDGTWLVVEKRRNVE